MKVYRWGQYFFFWTSHEPTACLGFLPMMENFRHRVDGFWDPSSREFLATAERYYDDEGCQDDSVVCV